MSVLETLAAGKAKPSPQTGKQAANIPYSAAALNPLIGGSVGTRFMGRLGLLEQTAACRRQGRNPGSGSVCLDRDKDLAEQALRSRRYCSGHQCRAAPPLEAGTGYPRFSCLCGVLVCLELHLVIHCAATLHGATHVAVVGLPVAARASIHSSRLVSRLHHQLSSDRMVFWRQRA